MPQQAAKNAIKAAVKERTTISRCSEEKRSSNFLVKGEFFLSFTFFYFFALALCLFFFLSRKFFLILFFLRMEEELKCSIRCVKRLKNVTVYTVTSPGYTSCIRMTKMSGNILGKAIITTVENGRTQRLLRQPGRPASPSPPAV